MTGRAAETRDRAVARVNELADAFATAYFDRYPELARQSGLDDVRYDDRLSDNTNEARRRWEAQVDAWRAELASVNAGLLEDLPAGVTYAVLHEELDVFADKRVCREHLWSVRQLGGWQESFALAAATQPVGTPAARGRLLARWRVLPRFLDNEIVNLREGLERGYSAPKGNVALVIRELDLLLAKPSGTYLDAPARRDGDPTLGRELGRVVESEIVPAIRRYRDFLRDEYHPRARNDVSVAALPDGAACYRACLREGNGLALSPEETHSIGLREVARVREEVRRIGEPLFGNHDPAEILARLGTDPKLLHPDAASMIACSEAAVARARAAAPRSFGRLPRAEVVVRRVPPERDAGGTAYYRPSSGPSEPATFWLEVANAEHVPRAECETTAFHEAIPGHHIQKTLAVEAGPTLDPIRRYFGFNGFGEGWALYAERLADETGLFTSDLDRLGWLSWEAVRAVRLVVDTGLHSKGWSRDEAIEYMLRNTGLSREFVESEVDRYIIWPGQATGYMLGMLEILKLREEAKAALGARFDLREFHDQLLELGNVPLSVMSAHVRAWLAREARTPR